MQMEAMARICHLPLFRESRRAQELRLARSDSESISKFLKKNAPDLWDLIDFDVDPDEADLEYYLKTFSEALAEECEQHGSELVTGCGSCDFLVDYQEREIRIADLIAIWLAKRLGVAIEEHDAEPLVTLTSHECGTWVPLPGRERIPTLTDLRFVHLEPPSAAGVYYIFVAGRVKIGMSQNIAKRLSEIATTTPEPPLLVAVELGDAFALEEAAHRRWETYRRHREWFACEGELLAWLRKENAR